MTKKNKVPFYGLSVDGKRITGSHGTYMPVYDPATDKMIAMVAEASTEDVNQAVEIAHERFHSNDWKKISARERGRMLHKAAELIREKVDFLSKIESENGGKPIRSARSEINAAADCFEYY
ncbi:MAG: aldehyde dehydrogenase family protein, partial [Spirochaetales bacterium]|nr:aldehyde dehydrogenase family protein [Spirochaetales bacterium]